MSRKPSDNWQFGVEPFVAWRGWNVQKIDGRYMMTTALGFHGYVWPARERAEAVCTTDHPVPCSTGCSHGCRCGFYAAKRREDVPFDPQWQLIVVGTVAMWGRVRVHRTGLRAQYAYPLELRAMRTKVPYRRRRGIMEELSATYALKW